MAEPELFRGHTFTELVDYAKVAADKIGGISVQRRDQLVAAFMFLMTGRIGGLGSLQTMFSTRYVVFVQNANLQAKIGKIEIDEAWNIVSDPSGLIIGPLQLEHFNEYEALAGSISAYSFAWGEETEDPRDLNQFLATGRAVN